MKRFARRLVTILAVLAVFALAFMPAAAAPNTQGYATYVVRWGDTLQGIANTYGCTLSALMQANGLTNPNFIYVGQVLSVPQAGPMPGPLGGTTYTVKWGDSLSSITYRHGVTVQAIMGANGLTNPNFIYAGQVLIIPGGQPHPQPQPQPQPQNIKTYYTVVAGDTLQAIAYRFGTAVEAIMQANYLASPHHIYPGQVLAIPGVVVPPHPAGTYYTVRPGDTLTRIALMYGTTVWAIMQANNLVNASLIYVGQTLVIPGQPMPGPLPYPTPAPMPGPLPYPTPWPVPPYPTVQWVGHITSSDCTNTDTNEFRSVLRISVIGRKGLSVKVSTSGWQTTGLTGTKPEYGEYAVEFAPFNQGTYSITLEGLGAGMQVRLDGKCTAYVEFRQVNVTSVTP
jgi:LysM repeat protein